MDDLFLEGFQSEIINFLGYILSDVFYLVIIHHPFLDGYCHCCYYLSLFIVSIVIIIRNIFYSIPRLGFRGWWHDLHWHLMVLNIMIADISNFVCCVWRCWNIYMLTSVNRLFIYIIVTWHLQILGVPITTNILDIFRWSNIYWIFIIRWILARTRLQVISRKIGRLGILAMNGGLVELGS